MIHSTPVSPIMRNPPVNDCLDLDIRHKFVACCLGGGPWLRGNFMGKKMKNIALSLRIKLTYRNKQASTVKPTHVITCRIYMYIFLHQPHYPSNVWEPLLNAIDEGYTGLECVTTCLTPTSKKGKRAHRCSNAQVDRSGEAVELFWPSGPACWWHWMTEKMLLGKKEVKRRTTPVQKVGLINNVSAADHKLRGRGATFRYSLSLLYEKEVVRHWNEYNLWLTDSFVGTR